MGTFPSPRVVVFNARRSLKNLSPVIQEREAERGISRSQNLCWKCRCRLTPSAIICKGNFCLEKPCGIVQPLNKSFTYTEVFIPEVESKNVASAFEIDPQALKNTYIKLQKDVHPDFWQAKSEELGKIAKDVSCFVNDGFRTLNDPLRRVKYLLQLSGVPIENSLSDNQEFLEKIFDLKLEMQSDDPIAAINAEKEAQLWRSRVIEEIRKAFIERDLVGASKQVPILQYIERTLNPRDGNTQAT